ncbi:MAG: hypothetical protein PHO28_00675 [Candidatus Pacebacteria bacterium]|nr:hypothetical protein [Candidatus Paceibacterota bacterium]
MKNKQRKLDGSNIGILGYGEVEQTIAKFYYQPKIKDFHHNNDLKGLNK